MYYSEAQVASFIAENDVKFIRLAFCDILGEQKNISIMSSQLERAFREGICFDSAATKILCNETDHELLLFPDPSTLTVLPWRPSHGRVVRLFCEIRNADGTVFGGDSRNLLKQATKYAADEGYTCQIGPECEFYLFKTDELGDPTDIPFDNGGYMDIAPLDKGENVRRDICFSLEAMGITPETSHHENGPGQNEIDFKYSEALAAADNLITFKSVVSTIAAQSGLFTSFSPLPIKGKCGNGLHINMSLEKDGKNLFEGSEEAHYFIAGILNRIEEITAFLNTMPLSYARLGTYSAPKYISWSKKYQTQLIRIPSVHGDSARMELRSPDPMLNPYIAFSLLLYAGLEGIEKKLPLCDPCDFNLASASKEVLKGLKTLPDSLESALKLAKNSDFVKTHVPELIWNGFVNAKRQFVSDAI